PRDASLLERTGDHLVRALHDLHRVVLDPPRLRIDLLVFLLLHGNDLARVIEDHEARAGCALVYRPCVVGHRSTVLTLRPPRPPRPSASATRMRWLPDP